MSETDVRRDLRDRIGNLRKAYEHYQTHDMWADDAFFDAVSDLLDDAAAVLPLLKV